MLCPAQPALPPGWPPPPLHAGGCLRCSYALSGQCTSFGTPACSRTPDSTANQMRAFHLGRAHGGCISSPPLAAAGSDNSSRGAIFMLLAAPLRFSHRQERRRAGRLSSQLMSRGSAARVYGSFLTIAANCSGVKAATLVVRTFPREPRARENARAPLSSRPSPMAR